MVFSSVTFICIFLPIFIGVLLLTPKKYRNYTILASSILFYAWGAPKFIFVILATTFIDYFLVNKMSTYENTTKRRLFLILSLSLNVGLLFYFKYSNFFIENVNAIFLSFGVEPIQWFKIILPIGISFYTFETITYVVDVYFKKHPPLKNFWDYQLYIMLFPKLIAGPIVRYHDLQHQIPAGSRDESSYNVLYGIFRFSIGLAKKVILANQIGTYADQVFNTIGSDQLYSIDVWLGVLAYTLQLYYDFSGYSDMAIGLAKVMGFDLKENFNNPYNATSITDFWRRWHMSLGAWMKNYIYIPLGGNQVHQYRNYFNLSIVFLLSGLWHGASWNFVLWGVFHGCFILIEKVVLLDKIYSKLPNWICMACTFFIVMNGWVLFRAETFADAVLIYSKMYQFTIGPSFLISQKECTYLILGLFGCMLFAHRRALKWQEYIYQNTIGFTPLTLRFIALLLLITISLSIICASNFNPFIYFRF